MFGGERIPCFCDFEKLRLCVHDADDTSKDQDPAFSRVSAVLNGFVHGGARRLTYRSSNFNRVAVSGGLIG